MIPRLKARLKQYLKHLINRRLHIQDFLKSSLELGDRTTG
jgi:hypothetical protein